MGMNEETKQHKVKKVNATRFLIISFAIVFIVCVGILALFAKITSKKSEETINKIGSMYMAGLNERIVMHFEATIDSRLSRVEYLVQSVPPEESTDFEQMEKELEYGAEARGLTHLALLTEDGDFEMLMGDQIELVDPEPFMESISRGDEKIAVGKSSKGEDVIVFGVPAEYPTLSGEKCMALTATVQVDYLMKLLALDDNYSLVYSHIIRRDGSFVIKSRESGAENYFDLIADYFLENSDKTPDTYVQELKEAMEKEEDYSALFYLENDRRHLYCTSLPYSEWYLITVMPYGSIDQVVNEMSTQRMMLLFVSIGGVLCVLLIIFVMYFRLTQRQIHELEETRQAAISASQAKSEFLSNMSHDIRTPMNAILGMTGIAISNIDNTMKVQDCLKKITLSGRHLLGLINDILDMSKIESGKLTLSEELVCLPEIMEGIVNIVQPQVKERQQHFDIFIYDVTEENIYCDSVRLNQMLLNLLSNAIKFTPEGGQISISLKEEDSPKGEDYVRVHLYVKDSGIGMTPEFMGKIFETFTREDSKRVQRTEGTGLGMAITKHIVDAMGGSIDVKSELGEGTEFHVILDLEKAVVQEEDMILPSFKMLLVDDDKEICESAAQSLTSIGIDADWTLDGESAVRMAEDKHARHEDYQVILLDWKMPGLDGIETARIIRSKLGDEVPILLISAYDWSDIEQEARKAGVTGFISKPLFKSTLFHGLKHYTENTSQPLERSAAGRKDFGGAKILVAEDNELNWEIANDLFSEFGMELEWAENGKICVDKFDQSPVGYYKAILMDIRMPIMTGYEATRSIRSMERADADIPIIAMTADAFLEDVKKCFECGMNSHVAKPIDVKEVIKLLDKFIS